MAFTFLELTNLALREVNEVPLTEQQFINARGLQQFAKEAVNRVYFEISMQSERWPWLQDQAMNTANLEFRLCPEGQQWHEINDQISGAKMEPLWDSFLLTDKDIRSTDPEVIASKADVVKSLKVLPYDEWLAHHRVNDFDSNNRGVPEYVVKFPSGKFGLSPIPDKTYYVEFNNTNSATRFTLPTDIIEFPEQFSSVLVNKVAYYVWKFRENHEQASTSLAQYKEGLGTMERLLLSMKDDVMRAV